MDAADTTRILPEGKSLSDEMKRWQRLYAEARIIETLSTNVECQQAAREIALMALDLIAETRAGR